MEYESVYFFLEMIKHSLGALIIKQYILKYNSDGNTSGEHNKFIHLYQQTITYYTEQYSKLINECD